MNACADGGRAGGAVLLPLLLALLAAQGRCCLARGSQAGVLRTTNVRVNAQ